MYLFTAQLSCILAASNRHAMKLFLCRSSILQFWYDLRTVAYTSDLRVSINPPHAHFSSCWKSSHQTVLISHPFLPYPGSTFALSSYFFAPRDVLIISSKNTISVYSTEQKNLIAESSIRLCFTGVENNKQGGELRSRRSPWDYCSKEIWCDYRKQ